MENFDAAVEKMYLLSKTERSIDALQGTADAAEPNIEIIPEHQFKKQKQAQSCTVTQSCTQVADSRKEKQRLALLSYQAAWIIVIRPS